MSRTFDDIHSHANYNDDRAAEPAIPDRLDVLDEANRYISADRSTNYGQPEDNFRTIAELWASYLSRRFGIRIPVEAYDISPMMILVKMARLANNPFHHDSYVDGAGYSATGGEVAARAAAQGRPPTSTLVSARFDEWLNGKTEILEELDE